MESEQRGECGEFEKIDVRQIGYSAVELFKTLHGIVLAYKWW